MSPSCTLALRFSARESDNCEVPTKAPNKDPQGSAEGLEGRRLILRFSAKENTGESNPSRTGDGTIGLRGLQGVREAAKKDKGKRFTALLHHVDEALLKASFYSLKRDAAPGVDRVTWQEYEQGVEERIKDLHGRVHLFALARGRLPRTAITTSLHTETRWAATPARNSRTGGQDCPTGSGYGPRADL